MREPQVVTTPWVLRTSFTASGNPASAGKASPRRDKPIETIGLLVGALGTKREKGVQLRIALFDAPAKLRGQFARGDALGGKGFADRTDRPVVAVSIWDR